MYSILIVDDERWVIESLKSRIHWNIYGFEVIGHANNGIEALEQISKLKPDVVFTDVRMPGMNGLELIKKANGMFPDTIFIVVSGYAEFDYVQKAMNYGAMGYCLKPFNEAEIISLLKKSREMLRKSISFESQFFTLVECHDQDRDYKIWDVFKVLGLKWDAGDAVTVVVSLGLSEIKFPEGVNVITLKIGINKKLHLVERKKHQVLADELSESINEDVKSIGIGPTIQSVIEINEAVESACIAAYHYFVTGRNGVYLEPHGNQNDMDIFLLQLGEYLKNKDASAMEKTFDALESCLSNGSYSVKDAFRAYNMVQSFVYVLTAGQYEGYLYSYEELINAFINVKSMVHYLKSLVVKTLTDQTGKKDNYIKNETLKHIMQYVNQNFWKDISVQSIAREYYVNANYISQLFKKETGRTFTEYLCKLRIEHACLLLSKTELPINEVSEKSGYNDYFYFNRIFKKNTGKTPSQYRSEEKL